MPGFIPFFDGPPFIAFFVVVATTSPMCPLPLRPLMKWTLRISSSIRTNIPRYGSTYNPNVRYPIPPPTGQQQRATTTIDDEDDFPLHLMTAARNEYDGAMEDFTNIDRRDNGRGGNDGDEARIFPPASARLFADAALVSDPIKVKWHNLHQLNECHPSLVKVPTMVVSKFSFVSCSSRRTTSDIAHPRPDPPPPGDFFGIFRVTTRSPEIWTRTRPCWPRRSFSRTSGAVSIKSGR